MIDETAVVRMHAHAQIQHHPFMLCHSEGEYSNIHTEHDLGIRLIIVMFMLQRKAENSFQLYV